MNTPAPGICVIEKVTSASLKSILSKSINIFREFAIDFMGLEDMGLQSLLMWPFGKVTQHCRKIFVDPRELLVRNS
jgi:hypothetical protein